jgi:predicted phosphodiesterase
MRVAALYDIHGNLPALEAVLADVARATVDAVVVGGDVVPGPMPRACLDRLRRLDLPVHWLHGNGEHDALAAAAGEAIARVPEAHRDVVGWSAEALGPDGRAFVAGWPDTVTLAIDGVGDVLFCHATPEDDNDIFTRDTDEARLSPVFAHVPAAMVVCGHTHLPFDRRVGERRVVNAGSVGMPFDEPGASWAVIGPGVDLRHVDYDRPAAAAAIRATSYPQAAAFADQFVLTVPGAPVMLAAFARTELRSRARSV